MGLLKRCGGSNICRITKTVHNACYSVLAYAKFIQSDILPSNKVVVPFKLSFSKKRLCNYYSSQSTDSTTRSAQSFVLPENVKRVLSALPADVKKTLDQNDSDYAIKLSNYCFTEGGKLIRPTVVLLMASAANSFTNRQENITESQRKVAIVSEMIHTASLVHDDVIDESNQRRNRPTVNAMAGSKTAILIGDYILAKATQLLASIGDPVIITLLAQVIEDLVKGEFMQLGSRSCEDDRFTHYMTKTFKKTASLFAHSCKAVAKLSGCDDKTIESAFDYGKNLGLAFQLVDDTLDFVFNERSVGKPTFVDLKLGIATAPVLFACRQHPELEKLILRRFSEPGDVEKAYELIIRSDGLFRSRQLADEHSRAAAESLRDFPDCASKQTLLHIAQAQSSRAR